MPRLMPIEQVTGVFELSECAGMGWLRQDRRFEKAKISQIRDKKDGMPKCVGTFYRRSEFLLLSGLCCCLSS